MISRPMHPGSLDGLHGFLSKYGYVPASAVDLMHVGRTTREGSRTLEYAFEDFAIRQVALLMNKTDDVEKYTNRSYNYRNVWSKGLVSDGYEGFFAKKTVKYVAASPTSPISVLDNVFL
jgi:putative alpha-1,2-mannosidase